MGKHGAVNHHDHHFCKFESKKTCEKSSLQLPGQVLVRNHSGSNEVFQKVHKNDDEHSPSRTILLGHAPVLTHISMIGPATSCIVISKCTGNRVRHANRFHVQSIAMKTNQVYRIARGHNQPQSSSSQAHSSKVVGAPQSKYEQASAIKIDRVQQLARTARHNTQCNYLFLGVARCTAASPPLLW